jgi:hypothetical protein
MNERSFRRIIAAIYVVDRNMWDVLRATAYGCGLLIVIIQAGSALKVGCHGQRY